MISHLPGCTSGPTWEVTMISGPTGNGWMGPPNERTNEWITEQRGAVVYKRTIGSLTNGLPTLATSACSIITERSYCVTSPCTERVTGWLVLAQRINAGWIDHLLRLVLVQKIKLGDQRLYKRVTSACTEDQTRRINHLCGSYAHGRSHFYSTVSTSIMCESYAHS